MKRLVTLSLICVLFLGLTTAAHAADIKATGEWAFEFIWSDKNFKDNDDSSKFDVYQRLRTKFEFIANENLKGVLYTESGTSTWGDDIKDGGDITDWSLKAGYIDFNWPGTEQNIKVGHFSVAFPSAVSGSMIQDDETPALMVSGPITDNVAYMASWIRADKGSDGEDSMDVALAALPLTFDGISVKPFLAYGIIGDNYTSGDADFGDNGLQATNAADSDTLNHAWWAGAAFEMNLFDPFVLKADLNYGKLDADEDTSEMCGWFADASLAYTGLDFLTPEVFFAYSSGEDTDDSSSRMPTLSNDWALGSFFFDGDWGLDGSIDGDAKSMGFWTVGLSLKDISFFEGLKHTVHVMYIQGTNDEDILDNGLPNNNVEFGKTLLDDDSLVEVDLNSQYSIYDELTAYVELGWIHADWSDKWDSVESDTNDSAYKVSMGLKYAF